MFGTANHLSIGIRFTPIVCNFLEAVSALLHTPSTGKRCGAHEYSSRGFYDFHSAEKIREAAIRKNITGVQAQNDAGWGNYSSLHPFL